MTTSDSSSVAAGEARPGCAERVDAALTPALLLVVLWMGSVLGFTGLAVALLAELSVTAVGVLAGAWLLPALAAAPVMLYDAYTVRGEPAGGGFRFDALYTGLVLFLVYPFGLPIYVVTRINGSYVAAIEADPQEMDLGDEFEFGIEDLLHPAADGVPSVWPTVLVLFAWGGVLFADGAAAVAALTAGTGAVLAAVAVAAVMHALGTAAVAFDLYLVVATGYLERGPAVAVTLAMALLYPLAAVPYVPYRLRLTYG